MPKRQAVMLHVTFNQSGPYAGTESVDEPVEDPSPRKVADADMLRRFSANGMMVTVGPSVCVSQLTFSISMATQWQEERSN